MPGRTTGGGQCAARPARARIDSAGAEQMPVKAGRATTSRTHLTRSLGTGGFGKACPHKPASRPTAHQSGALGELPTRSMAGCCKFSAESNFINRSRASSARAGRRDADGDNALRLRYDLQYLFTAHCYELRTDVVILIHAIGRRRTGTHKAYSRGVNCSLNLSGLFFICKQ